MSKTSAVTTELLAQRVEYHDESEIIIKAMRMTAETMVNTVTHSYRVEVEISSAVVVNVSLNVREAAELAQALLAAVKATGEAA